MESGLSSTYKISGFYSHRKDNRKRYVGKGLVIFCYAFLYPYKTL